MLIEKKNGEYLILRILDYQFSVEEQANYKPDEGDEENIDEFDWVFVLLRVQNEYHDWWVIDACMTAEDIQILANWFQALSNDDLSVISFLSSECNLYFELLTGDVFNKKIKISFDREVKARYFFENKMECSITFDLANNELKSIADDLNRDCLKTPIRNVAYINRKLESQKKAIANKLRKDLYKKP